MQFLKNSSSLKGIRTDNKKYMNPPFITAHSEHSEVSKTYGKNFNKTKFYSYHMAAKINVQT